MVPPVVVVRERAHPVRDVAVHINPCGPIASAKPCNCAGHAAKVFPAFWLVNYYSLFFGELPHLKTSHNNFNQADGFAIAPLRLHRAPPLLVVVNPYLMSA